MNRETEPNDVIESDAVDTILTHASPRPRPSAQARERAFVNLKRNWMLTIRRRRRSHRIYAVGVVASIVLVVAISLQFDELPGRGKVFIDSKLVRVAGSEVRINDRSLASINASNKPVLFFDGDMITTGQNTRIALSWQSSGSLRLNADSQVAFLSPQSVRLNYGTLYFDSRQFNAPRDSAAHILIEALNGTVSHVGTQFMADVSPARVRVTVREGTVEFDGASRRLSVPSGESVDIYADDSVNRQAVLPSDQQWNWVAAIAPQVEFDGRSTFDLLTWIARETGRELEFDSISARNLATTDRLVGMEHLAPARALEFVPVISDLDYEIDDRKIIVRAKASHP